MFKPDSDAVTYQRPNQRYRAPFATPSSIDSTKLQSQEGKKEVLVKERLWAHHKKPKLPLPKSSRTASNLRPKVELLANKTGTERHNGFSDDSIPFKHTLTS
mmetsp:Transcript_9833/g.19042  ORF Transcript_9833/g.19042 Transcript_9833/m.19042 type:complete len:102 (+) Transcript_9833:1821-2126(+)